MKWLCVGFLLCAVSSAHSKDIYLHCNTPDCDSETNLARYRESEDCQRRCIISNITTQVEEDFDQEGYAYTLQQFRALQFENCTLTSIPEGTFLIMPHLEKLNISRTALETISAEDFIGARDLASLDASHNKITELPSQLLLNLPRVFVIDLSFNQIANLRSDIFDGGNEISELNLSHNRIVTVYEGAFWSQISLRRVSLAHNEINRIDPGAFTNNKQLQTLDLSGNRLGVINCRAFHDLPFEMALNLSANYLAEFHPNCFDCGPDNVDFYYYAPAIVPESTIPESKCPVLDFDVVDLSGTRITETHIPENFTFKMRDLWLRNTNTTNLHEFFGHFQNLKYLDLSNSRVGPLNVITFAKLKELEQLALRNCGLDYITYGIFHSQKQLRKLDISYNSIHKINFSVFLPSLSGIHEIYLDGNGLETITGLSSRQFGSLQKLGLLDNQLECSEVLGIINEFGRSINFPISDLTGVRSHVNGIPCRDNDF